MTGLPNTFQVFNVYIDRAMPLLSDSEFRVLMFATRHILGWQDRVDERQGHISISMFEKGFTTSNGVFFAGCGLSRQTIVNSIASLVEFGFLERAGKPTSKGQKYSLETKGIDWLALDQRRQSQFEGNKKRTAKANKSRRSGTSDNTGMLDNTMRGTSDNTMLGTLDNTQTNPSSKPTTKPAPLLDPMADAISHVWKTKASGIVDNIKFMMLGTARSVDWSRCNFDPPANPQEILSFGKWWKQKHPDLTIPNKPEKIQRWFYEYRDAAAKKITPIDPAHDLSIPVEFEPVLLQFLPKAVGDE